MSMTQKSNSSLEEELDAKRNFFFKKKKEEKTKNPLECVMRIEERRTDLGPSWASSPQRSPSGPAISTTFLILNGLRQ